MFLFHFSGLILLGEKMLLRGIRSNAFGFVVGKGSLGFGIFGSDCFAEFGSLVSCLTSELVWRGGDQHVICKPCRHQPQVQSRIQLLTTLLLTYIKSPMALQVLNHKAPNLP